MAQENANADDASVSKQAEYIQQIEKIAVDPDDIITHFTKNLRNRNTLYDARSLKLSVPRDGGAATASVGVDPRDDGGYYDSQPHPIWLNPSAFIQGASPGEDDGDHNGIGLPDEAENRRIMRDTVDIDEDTEEFEEEHEKAMETWEEMWETALESDLKDEIEFEFPLVDNQGHQVGTETHTVPVEYDE